MDLSPDGHTQCLGAYICVVSCLRIADAHPPTAFVLSGPIFRPEDRKFEAPVRICVKMNNHNL